MKKIASLLLTAALLAAMLTVLAVPAFAAEEIAVDQTKIITKSGNYIISKPGVYETQMLRVIPGSKLTIAEGVTLKVTHVLNNQGQIDLLGTLDLSQCSGGIDDNEIIHVGDTGEFIYDPYNIILKGQITGTGRFTATKELPEGYHLPEDDGGRARTVQDPHHYSSIISEGSLTIIVGIAAAVVFGLGGFFIGKAAGKKKPALADGADNTDEE